MDERINQIRERVEKATVGKWKVEKIYDEEPYEKYIKSAAIVCNGYMVTRNNWSNPVMADLEFIANAREDIPYLLDKISELQEQNEVLKDTVNMLSPLIMENYELKNNTNKDKRICITCEG